MCFTWRNNFALEQIHFGLIPLECNTHDNPHSVCPLGGTPKSLLLYINWYDSLLPNFNGNVELILQGMLYCRE